MNMTEATLEIEPRQLNQLESDFEAVCRACFKASGSRNVIPIVCDRSRLVSARERCTYINDKWWGQKEKYQYRCKNLA